MQGPSARGWRWTTWPRRTLWPTRDGWWCLAAAIALGFAAMNTGNNLLYLLVSMLLGLVIVSGMLSEQSVRGLHFTASRPDEVFVGRPALFGVRIENRKRWRSSYSIVVEVLDGPARRSVYLPRLPAGASELVTWDVTMPARGRRPFPSLRVSTAFPFGLFVKAGHVALDAAVVVYPPLVTLSPDRDRAAGIRVASGRHRGPGTELRNLREYRAGDDPRLIHWRSSAKAGALVVREFEGTTAADARIVLVGSGHDRERLEAGLSEAASLVVRLLRRGGRVELVAPAAYVAPASGREARTRLLTSLALYDPSAEPGSAARGAARPAREIRVSIG